MSAPTSAQKRPRRHRRLVTVVGVLTVLVAVVAVGLYVSFFQTPKACTAPTSASAVCGLNNPEDLLRLSDSPWVLTSDLGNRHWESGGFSVINTADGRTSAVSVDFTQPARPAYAGCPGPPEPDLVDSHGISLRQDADSTTVFAVNHGGRESIEVFTLDSTEVTPRLTWVGCAVLPEDLSGNSVAALDDGGFLATVPTAHGLSQGAVYRWHPTSGWTELDHLDLESPNGILVSADQNWIYVAEWSGQRVGKAPLDGSSALLRSDDLGFLVDNLRFAPDGTILATGQETSPLLITACNATSVPVCPSDTEVAAIDPATLEATPLWQAPRTDSFGGGTSAIVVDDELWVSSFRSPSLLTVPLADLPSIGS